MELPALPHGAASLNTLATHILLLRNGLYMKGFSHLARILASLEVANADHVAGDLSRIGGLTRRLTKHRSIQALQQVWVFDFKRQEMIGERKNMSQTRLG